MSPSPLRTLDAPYPYLERFRLSPSGSPPAFQPSFLHLFRPSRYRFPHRSSMFGPSLLLAQKLLCPRLTSVRPSFRLMTGVAQGRRTDLPGYCAPTFLPHARRIYTHPFRMAIGLWVFLPPRPVMSAFYALRVPRAGSLRTASFRPHLAVAALAVRLMVPAIRVHRGLSPPSQCALPGAQEKREGGTLPSLERVGPSWPVYAGGGRNLEMSPLLSSLITLAASS